MTTQDQAAAPDQAVRCLVCGSATTPRRDGAVYRCLDCAFGWTAAELAPAGELYGPGYFQGDGYQDYFQPKQRRFEASRRLRWLLGSGRPHSIVEAGSAGGYFVEAARIEGIITEGVELSESAARFARDELGVPVRCGPFETATFTTPPAAVCAFHVLEHVEDPHEFLRAAGAALAPAGLLALEVPNIASAAARRLGAAWPHIEPRYHRWHFTPGSLVRLLTAHGFEVVRQDTVFSRFYWRHWPRLTHARELLVADWVASGSPRLSHPTLGDALRVIARSTGAGRPPVDQERSA